MFIGFTFQARATLYGENSLRELRESQDPRVLEAGRAVAVEISNFNFPDDMTQEPLPLFVSHPADHGICSSEPFLHQPQASVCTGFLVAPDILLTAGHCMGEGLSCSNAKWVFDYALNSADQTTMSIPQSSVYHCTGLLKSSYANHVDYAFIRLDRPVLDRKPLVLNREMPIEKGHRLLAITAPYGLALKTSTGVVRDDSQPAHFISNLDLMRGSSGGPIFDAATLQVVGIVAQGERDLDAGPDINDLCNVFYRCDDDACMGEFGTRLSIVPPVESQP